MYVLSNDTDTKYSIILITYDIHTLINEQSANTKMTENQPSFVAVASQICDMTENQPSFVAVTSQIYGTTNNYCNSHQIS